MKGILHSRTLVIFSASMDIDDFKNCSKSRSSSRRMKKLEGLWPKTTETRYRDGSKPIPTSFPCYPSAGYTMRLLGI